MGRLIEPIGAYSITSYRIEQAGCDVFCLEELCFVLCKHAFLMDQGIVNKELVDWIDRCCQLPELAKQLYPLVNQKGSAGAFAGMILDYAGYESVQKRREVEELLKESADTDITTRLKRKADYLMKKGHYLQAIIEYEKMLEMLPAMHHEMRAAIYNNKGVALCRLFDFQGGSIQFLHALEENPGVQEYELHYLAALRMWMSQEEYIRFIADHKIWYESSILLEERYDAVKKQYEDSEVAAQIDKITELKQAGEGHLYYEEVSRKLSNLKQRYREMVL